MPDASAALVLSHDRTQRTALIALFAGALAIAFAPIFVRLSEVGPTATAFWRVALATPVLAAWMVAERPGFSRRSPTGFRDFAGLALAGVFLAGDLIIWHLSLRYTSVANSTLLANFAPMFVAPVSFLLFGERFRRSFLAGLAMAVAGAVLLMGQSFRLNADQLYGDALALLSATFYAGYILAIGRLRAAFTTATVMAWSSAITAVAVLPVALAFGETMLPASLDGWAVLAGLALVSHVGGQSLIAHALAHLPAAFSSVSLLLQPAGAAILAWVLFAEPLGALQAAGAAVILGGILLARRGSR
ncbi:DMT family transporter [Azospirillum thermophilum]|uniref:EamA family transporter n=1 Tax=Azospirillum thermophilum TaxID=2202148 RepID=A0A2S2CQN8_9PROT|nr:DMT family transporter [Azospirillum thermophilum]AWK86617.1 EamA family transporter [Azospirillum thermophilum]